jgi:hypothetical protein
MDGPIRVNRRDNKNRLRGLAGSCGVAVFLALAGSLPGAVALAQDAESGQFEIQSANSELVDGVYYLDVAADLRLSADGREALESGLPLSIMYEIQFLHRHRLWWDTEQATLRQRFQIEYHTLTERFRVTNVNSGDLLWFSNLEGALRFIGRMENLPLIDAGLLDSDGRYDVRLRAVLDTEQLPGPLRLLAFWRSEWALASDWQRWRLVDE